MRLDSQFQTPCLPPVSKYSPPMPRVCVQWKQTKAESPSPAPSSCRWSEDFNRKITGCACACRHNPTRVHVNGSRHSNRCLSPTLKLHSLNKGRVVAIASRKTIDWLIDWLIDTPLSPSVLQCTVDDTYMQRQHASEMTVSAIIDQVLWRTLSSRIAV